VTAVFRWNWREPNRTDIRCSTYIDLWKTLPADSEVDETIRNFFIRQPVLWVK
jgi:hypothetical protein